MKCCSCGKKLELRDQEAVLEFLAPNVTQIWCHACYVVEKQKAVVTAGTAVWQMEKKT